VQLRHTSAFIALLIVATTAWAQEPGLDRITPLPEGGSSADTMLSTRGAKKSSPADASQPSSQGGNGGTNLPPLPWTVAPSNAPAPFAHAPATTGQPGNYLPSKVPFGHASMPVGPEVPSGPHDAIASPVAGVDAVQTSEPAPPTPLPPGANPAQEDPAQPTELTSPMFDEKDSGTPRRIVIRALNKVSGQAEILKIKPGETVAFGRLQILGVTCRTSIPTSQTDYAGLLDVRERLPGNEGMKPVFRGWMYASSPSITALEHPIYDLAMVDCDIAAPTEKAKEKSDKSDDKKAAPAKKK
jgi:hypothetical protein